jgi:regulator of protease activity HflC (stomatin/prohibitin superfamily)
VFDRILDWIDRGWHFLKPFFIVDCFEKAGVLRFGKYHRSAMPGFHWKVPLIEKVMEVTAVETTWHSPAQPLTTKDDVAVTVTTVVRYEVTDPKHTSRKSTTRRTCWRIAQWARCDAWSRRRPTAS